MMDINGNIIEMVGKVKSSINNLIYEDNTKKELGEAELEEKVSFSDEFSKLDIVEDIKEVEEFKENTVDTTIVEPTYEQDVTPDINKPIETAIITSGTNLNGNIKTTSHIKIEGSIHGNIDTIANITIVDGEVVGDIKGSMVGTSTAKVKGNIISEDVVEILEESFIEGNISGNKVYISGRVTGNITCDKTLILSSEAVVEGDICTKLLRIEEGGIINGRITII